MQSPHASHIDRTHATIIVRARTRRKAIINRQTSLIMVQVINRPVSIDGQQVDDQRSKASREPFSLTLDPSSVCIPDGFVLTASTGWAKLSDTTLHFCL